MPMLPVPKRVRVTAGVLAAAALATLVLQRVRAGEPQQSSRPNPLREASSSATRDRASARSDDSSVAPEVPSLTVTRPTVVAYLVVQPGAVDTQPELAVLADDWAYAMAALGDSVAARGFAFALHTDSTLVVRRSGRPPDTLALGAAGYVLIPGAGGACVGRGAMEPDALLAAATRFFRARATPRGKWRCESDAGGAR